MLRTRISDIFAEPLVSKFQGHLPFFIKRVIDMTKLVHVCPECNDEFHTEAKLVDHLNVVHEYDWSYREYRQICGNMAQKWKEE